jgi:hypothetical protein
MSSLEDDLRRSLRREEPSAGFTQRVLDKARRPWWATAGARIAIAAVLLVGIGLGVRSREEQRRGEQARDQLLLALRLAGGKLNQTQAKAWQLDVHR